MDKQDEQLIAAHRAEMHRAPPHLVSQWHGAIDDAAALERGRKRNSGLRWHAGSFFWGIAVTATLVFGIGIGYFLSGSDALAPYGTGPDIASVDEDARFSTVAFSRGLRLHLRDSRETLSKFDPEADQALLIRRIVEQNRLFEAAAERNESPQLARVLRAFEPILLELAASDTAPDDAAALRAKLAFELDVMLTKLASESSDDSQTT